MAAGSWTVLDAIPDILQPTTWRIEGADVADGKIWVLLFDTSSISATALRYRVWVYDPATGDWTQKATSAAYDSPEGSCGFRAVGNRLYHLTRKTVGSVKTMIHIAYDRTTDTFHNLTAPVLSPAEGGETTFTNAGTARLDDDHYAVFGGYLSFPGGLRTKAARYTISTDSWENNWKTLLDGQGASNNQYAVTRYGDSEVIMHRGLFSAPTNEYQVHGFDVAAGTFHYEEPLDSMVVDAHHVNRIGFGHDGVGVWVVGGHWWTASDASDRVAYYESATDTYWHGWDGAALTNDAGGVGNPYRFAAHPHGAGTDSLWVLRLEGFIYTVGGAFTSDWQSESLCRFTPPFPLPDFDPYEGWGILD